MSGWKESVVFESKGVMLEAKMRGSKRRMKRWLGSNKLKSDSVSKVGARLDRLDSEAMRLGWNDSSRRERVSLLAEIWSGLRKEEQKWRQKSRVKWLKEGDRNSKFFHMMADGRRRRNFIGDLTFNGVVVQNPKLIKEGVLNFFQDHFKNVNWQRPKINGLNFNLLSVAEKEGLEMEFKVEEVWETVNGWDGNKAPGLDELNLNFINKDWEEIREDFMTFILEFYDDGSVVRELNTTFITLIPKKKRLTMVNDFRPIRLVGSMHKILANVLSNRIKRVMKSVGGDFQMAFVEGRQITNSFVIAEEIINKWKRDGDGGVVIKLDFEKAYDSTDPGFLDEVLGCMGFGDRWRSWISECVSSPLMSILINGSPTPQFGIKRGLR
ncbi:hypothetical protein Dsin_023229 [Dipteronia sinensis]|uniref:Reverse transcriptase domain-containing protein n=1 Tax=Dipteronia sinensis TaxID=43782 RepID=A0AAE0A426_9ROSI|nr:hypothetical protein Dsin_023229 [Dipteronia sinensis]